MLANYLIGLREGLEASLVVGILIAYLVRTGNRDRVWLIWSGVGVAVALSLAFGAGLTFTSQSLSFTAQEAFGGFLSIIAVAFVTWMVFWMRRAARGIKGELHGHVDQALRTGGLALALVAFVAVAREGLETALFLWSSVRSTTSGTAAWPSLTGALLGLATAVLLGYLIYRGALRLNLATFFRWTGAALIVVAAGVLAYAVHDLQEAGILPGLGNTAFDISATVAPSGWFATIVRGVFNVRPEMTVLEVVAYLAYLVPVLVVYSWPQRVSAPAARETAASTA